MLFNAIFFIGFKPIAKNFAACKLRYMRFDGISYAIIYKM